MSEPLARIALTETIEGKPAMTRSHLNTHTAPVRHSATRRLSAIEWLTLAAIAGLLVGAVLLGAGKSHEVSTTTPVRVQGGDTLWSLATEHPVTGLSTAQTADLIAEINGLGGAHMLQAGSMISVPMEQDAPALAMR